MSTPKHPDTRTRADLRDHEPRPLRPDVVQDVVSVPLADIEPGPGEFATRVDLRLAPMVEALTRDGQTNPVHLLSAGNTGPWQILCGHRRIAALRKMGRTHVNAILHQFLATEEAWRLAWTDNADRKTMSANDRMFTVARLLHAGNTQATVAAILGIDRSAVSRDAAWLRLPESVRDRIADIGFTFAHAAALLPFANDARMAKVQDLLAQLKAKPCDAKEFRSRVRKFFVRHGHRPRTGVRMNEAKIVIDRKRFDPTALNAPQRKSLAKELERLLELVRGAE
jgi:ParB/RepB/Spo0J family partition protein